MAPRAGLQAHRHGADLRPALAQAHHATPRWGSEPLDEVMPIQAQAWKTRLGKTYACSAVDRRPIVSAFRRMLEDAYINGLVPCSALPVRRLRPC